MSSATLSNDTLSFSVDRERDPFDDDFHGIWEEFDNGSFLTISARGVGKVDGSEVTGTFEGLFTSRELTDPRQSGTPYVDRYCSAKDHRFPFVWQ